MAGGIRSAALQTRERTKRRSSLNIPHSFAWWLGRDMECRRRKPSGGSAADQGVRPTYLKTCDTLGFDLLHFCLSACCRLLPGSGISSEKDLWSIWRRTRLYSCYSGTGVGGQGCHPAL